MRVFLFGDTVVNYGERTVGEEEGRPTISRALVVFFFLASCEGRTMYVRVVAFFRAVKCSKA